MKKEIRKNLLEKRKKLEYTYVKNYGEKLFKKFRNSKEYKNSNIIMSYMNIKNEVDTKYFNEIIIKDGKKLVLPTINNNDEIESVLVENLSEMKIGKYNISEPIGNIIDKQNIDLIIIPGVGFDKYGNRIGFGKGYYDKFLKNYEGLKIGVCYKFQVVNKIITDEYDVQLDEIIYLGNDYKIIDIKFVEKTK